MDWLQDLLWNPNSVAHIVFLYAFVVAAGVYLGKIKIFGVSRGYLCFVCRHPNGTFWLHRRYPYPTFHPRIRIDIVRILYRSSGGAFFLLFI